ncbi:MAG: zinc-ribbon domain-containing protein [Clostridia bacterium]|nr:zinc-ribbon domain-containing protein [Clostridia bacterium]
MKKEVKAPFGSVPFSTWCEENGRTEMLNEWDREKNPMCPDQVSYGSTKQVFWKCRLGHEWESTVNNRTNQKNGCPYCGNKRVLKGFNDLVTTHPSVARFWHPTKNGDRTAEDYVSQSNTTVWWKCTKGHEFQTRICIMVNSTTECGCPICANLKVLYGYNDLETVCPSVAREWNHIKNGSLKPAQVVYGSHKKVWWICQQGHEWKAEIVSRTSSGTGCPYCAGQKVLSGINDLQTVDPALAQEWDFELNDPTLPSEVFSQGNRSYWWKCANGHSYKASMAQRSRGCGCPYCVGKKVWPGYNDLQSTNPTLASEWHPTLNMPLQPTEVSCGSDRKVWWRCSRQHEWQATISSRNHGNGCPECAKGLQSSLPEKTILYYVKKYWPDTLNNVRFPWLNKQEIDIYIPTLSVGIEYDGDYWHREAEKDMAKDKLCAEYGVHLIRVREPECPAYEAEYSYHITTRAAQANILYMEAVIRKLFEYLDHTFQTNVIPEVDIQAHYPLILQDCATAERENSFAFTHPQLLSEWHAEKNAPLRPEDFARGSQKKVWWKCEKGHEWKAAVLTRTRGAQCPYCTGRYVLAGFNDFATVHPEYLSEWDNERNLPLLPTRVLHSSNIKVWWKCAKGHSWQTMISVRLKGNNCPYCSNQKILAGYNDLATTHPDLVKEWDYDKNDLSPNAVCSGTEKSAWWICPEGHSYYANIRSRAKLGTGCKTCYHNKKSQ